MPDRARQSRRGLFVFMFITTVLLAAYTVYWFYMANQLKIGVVDWIEDQREAGYEMEHFQEVFQFAHQDMVEDLTRMEKQSLDQQRAA